MFEIEWTWQKGVLVVFVLALFGFNIFSYISEATDKTTGFVNRIFTPFLKLIAYLGLSTSKTIVQNTADGTVAVVTKVEDVIVSGIDKVSSSSSSSSSVETDLKKDLQKRMEETQSTEVEPAEKGGWCFIGSERLLRSCIAVGENDTCMSGDIFPTEQICINPTLRP